MSLRFRCRSTRPTRQPRPLPLPWGLEGIAIDFSARPAADAVVRRQDAAS